MSNATAEVDTISPEEQELRDKIRKASMPACCRDLPPFEEIKAGFQLELVHPIQEGKETAVAVLERLTFRDLVFEDLDALKAGAGEISFADFRQLIHRSTRAAPSLLKKLHLVDAQRAMYVVSAFLQPLRP